MAVVNEGLSLETMERLSYESRQLLRSALTQALMSGDREIRPEHIMLALAGCPVGPTADVIARVGGTTSVRRLVYRAMTAQQQQ